MKNEKGLLRLLETRLLENMREWFMENSFRVEIMVSDGVLNYIKKCLFETAKPTLLCLFILGKCGMDLNYIFGLGGSPYIDIANVNLDAIENLRNRFRSMLN